MEFVKSSAALSRYHESGKTQLRDVQVARKIKAPGRKPGGKTKPAAPMDCKISKPGPIPPQFDTLTLSETALFQDGSVWL